MSDLVSEYVSWERELLTHRLRVLLSGVVLAPDDPEEDRIEAEFERIWKAMTPDERRALDRACDRRVSPWLEPAADGTRIHDRAARGGPYSIWVRALVDAVEISLPPATRSRLTPSRARTARMLVAWDEIESVPGAARAVLVDAALLLLGRSLDEARRGGGIRLVDPDSGETLLSADVAASGVAETPDAPHA